jgi:kinesin family protein 2/24
MKLTVAFHVIMAGSAAEKKREKLLQVREQQADRKEQELNDLDSEAVLGELKKKGLPTFGTSKERLDRLKKSLGIQSTNSSTVDHECAFNTALSANKVRKLTRNQGREGSDSKSKKSNVIGNIEAIQRRREERRKRMEDERIAKEERRAENEAAGRCVDVEFEAMIAHYRARVTASKPFTPADNLKICVCVRKRPIFMKEGLAGEIDAISCTNPHVIVHEPKVRVDGITKYLENYQFTFNNSFGDADDTPEVYANSLRPLCPFILAQGTVTCFAYGQTGSGKTYTMKGLQSMVVQDLFSMASQTAVFCVSFYEIYGGKCFDLLNGREKLKIMEDRNGNIQVAGLVEKPAESARDVHGLIECGNAARTTHSTTTNSDSSRSHAICQLIIRDCGQTVGQLRLVDLAVRVT